VPIVLGTIPFHQNFAQYTPAPENPPLGWNINPSAPHRDGSPNYPDLREYHLEKSNILVNLGKLHSTGYEFI
jgi:hypothetical protein